MTNTKYEKAEAIAKKYEGLDQRLQISKKLLPSDDSYLYPRLLRAVINQIDEGDATFSRYAIFIDTVITYIDQANGLIECGKNLEATKILKKSINSLSAFSEIQMEVFDTIFNNNRT